MTPSPTPNSSAPRPKPRRSPWRIKLLATLIGTALTLTCVEGILQVFDPIGRNHETEHLRYRQLALRYAWDGLPPGRFSEIDLDGLLYHQKPNLDIDLGSYQLKTNNLGYRGPTIPTPKPAGTYRILVLGDSVCYGTGVNDEVTFLRRWETTLNAHGTQRYEVVNTGHPMYDTTQELALLRNEGLALQPDMVLLVYVVNDIEPTRDVVEQALLGLPPKPGEALNAPGDTWTRLADLCRPLMPATAKLFELQSDPVARWLSSMPQGTHYAPELFGKGPRGWARSKQALLEIRDLCRQAQVPLFLLDHTMPALEALPSYCASVDIPYYAFRFSAEELKLPIRNSMLDSHSNAAGHALLLAKLQSIAKHLPLPE